MKLTEIEFRKMHRLRPEVRARLEALDEFQLRLAQAGVTTWTFYYPGPVYDEPTVRFYFARKYAFAEWSPVTGRGISIDQEPPFEFRAKNNPKVLAGIVKKMARRISVRTFARQTEVCSEQRFERSGRGSQHSQHSGKLVGKSNLKAGKPDL